MTLELVEPSPSIADAFLEMATELRDAGEGLAGMEALDRSGLPGYLDRLAAARAGLGLAPGHVAMSTFWLVADGRHVVALSRLRHRLTPTLRQHGGHIGFVVRPTARRRGVGVALLALTLERARGIGLGRVLLTCDADNHGSRRVIERNGGVIEAEEISPESGKLIRRYWIELGASA
jgi:predicted acetyltransferase